MNRHTCNAAPITSSETKCACPRCGYDQRGVVRTWTEQCPMEGTCSECGLVFAWCEVLCPEKFEPRWCVEFEPRGLRVPWACVKTCVRSFWPWAFWSRLKMSHPVRVKRLVIYLMLILLPAMILYVVIQAAVAIRVRSIIEDNCRQRLASAIAFLPQLKRMAETGVLEGPYARRQAGESSLGPTVLEQVKSELVWAQTYVSSPPSINMSYTQAVFEAIAHPFGVVSQGTVSVSGRTHSYVAPCDVHMTLFRNGYWGRDQLFQLTMDSVRWFGLSSLLLFAMPLSFALLPVSRRRAKVRWIHLGRITAYGLFIPITLTWIIAICFLLGLATKTTDDGWASVLRLVATWGPALMLVAWWWSAIRNYLRMPHALFTTLVLMLMCALSIMAALWLVEPDLLIEL